MEYDCFESTDLLATNKLSGKQSTLDSSAILFGYDSLIHSQKKNKSCDANTANINTIAAFILD